MSVIRITEQERSEIIATRPYGGGERNSTQKKTNIAIFKRLKSKYGIPSNKKVKLELDAKSNPDYLVLKDKETNQPFRDIYADAKEVAAPPPWAAPPKAPPSAWPFPDSPDSQHSTAKVASDLGKVAAQSSRMGHLEAAAPSHGAEMRMGSINLDDALQLLRSEGDLCDSHASSSEMAPASVFVKNGRLYFAL